MRHDLLRLGSKETDRCTLLAVRVETACDMHLLLGVFFVLTVTGCANSRAVVLFTSLDEFQATVVAARVRHASGLDCWSSGVVLFMTGQVTLPQD